MVIPPALHVHRFIHLICAALAGAHDRWTAPDTGAGALRLKISSPPLNPVFRVFRSKSHRSALPGQGKKLLLEASQSAGNQAIRGH